MEEDVRKTFKGFEFDTLSNVVIPILDKMKNLVGDKEDFIKISLFIKYLNNHESTKNILKLGEYTEKLEIEYKELKEAYDDYKDECSFLRREIEDSQV